MDDKEQIQLLGLARAVIGGLLFLAPGTGMKVWIGEGSDTPSARAAARGLGARDVAIGMGTLLALESGKGVREWLLAGVAADSADAISALGSFREASKLKSLVGLAIAGGAAVIGLRLAESVD